MSVRHTATKRPCPTAACRPSANALTCLMSGGRQPPTNQRNRCGFPVVRWQRYVSVSIAGVLAVERRAVPEGLMYLPLHLVA